MVVLCAAPRGACARVCAQMKRLCCCRSARCPPARPPPRPHPRPRKEQSVAERRGLTARVSGVEPPPPSSHTPPEAPERPALPSSSDLNGSPDAARFAPSHPFRRCSFTVLNEPDELRRADASGISSAAELLRSASLCRSSGEGLPSQKARPNRSKFFLSFVFVAPGLKCSQLCGDAAFC